MRASVNREASARAATPGGAASGLEAWPRLERTSAAKDQGLPKWGPGRGGGGGESRVDRDLGRFQNLEADFGLQDRQKLIRDERLANAGPWRGPGPILIG